MTLWNYTSMRGFPVLCLNQVVNVNIYRCCRQSDALHKMDIRDGKSNFRFVLFHVAANRTHCTRWTFVMENQTFDLFYFMREDDSLQRYVSQR